MQHKGRVVAIGIDAAEHTLVERLVQRNELPHLGALLAHGASGRIGSPSHIGSGAVWPTFSTGTEPAAHGIYSFWDWHPQRMRVMPVAVETLRPFWRDTANSGYAVGVLDVPFTSPVGLPRGIEITEWGPHDSIRRKTEILPLGMRDLVLTTGRRHPFSTPPLDAWGKIQDVAGRAELVRSCVIGVEQRGALISQLLSRLDLDLCIAVFTEVHRASHLLWHTIEARAMQSGSPEPGEIAGDRSLIDIYRAVDQQIGRILNLLNADDTFLVFSLHGMRPCSGIPTVLDDLLHGWGLATPGTWKTDSWSTHARRALETVRRHMPAAVRAVYHRRVSPAVTLQVAGPPQAPNYDWARTTAFALPTDQHGWIRVNLAGREARGTLAPESYDETCDAIEDLLHGVVTADDQSVVRRVLRLVSDSGPSHNRLPDLVVHWNDTAIGPHTCLRSPSIPIHLRATHLTGQHSPDGFFSIRVGAGKIHNFAQSIEAKDLHVLLSRLVAGG